jgi:serine/threonine-protein kinase
MSPEQSAGDREIDGRSDLYALGVVAYQMLAGELPFQATSTPAMLVKHLSERPVPVDLRRPDCPRDLAAIVMRLLEKEPQHRFASAAELEEALNGMPVPPLSYATTQPPLAPGPMGGNGAPLPPMAQTAPGDGRSTRPDMSFRLGGAGFDVTFGAGRGGGMQPSPAGGAPTPYGVTDDVHLPTPEEQLRWEAAQVATFRRKLGWYVIINAVFLLIALFGERDFLGFTGLWTIYIAFKYAKLWSDGYDWHDVLRQPRDRLFADVVAEWGDDVSAMFDENKRGRLREKARRRRLAYATAERPAIGPGGGSVGVARPLEAAELSRLGVHAEPVRQAIADRDEVLRLLATMPKPERDRIPDVEPSARALGDKIVTLGRALAELDRDAAPGAADVVEQEISRLEAAANPLDRTGSEERVRRLAYLKRQRRTIAELGRRREMAASKLDGCRLALQNMRLDLVRLRTGAGSPAR